MFKWLDLLEKEFDRSFVQLDLLLGDIDQDQEEITNDGRFCFTFTKNDKLWLLVLQKKM